MNSPAKLAAVGAVAAAVGGGIFAEISLDGKHVPKPSAKLRAQVRGPRDGPAHGLMLLPLADPDRRKPTASVDR
ncbi:MAG: hypothetical protein H0W87_07320 [Actinobacteria bacterium]|nr:hypothetical protein [Actinomycetota bacterium]